MLKVLLEGAGHNEDVAPVQPESHPALDCLFGFLKLAHALALGQERAGL